MMKRILILLFCMHLLSASAQLENGGTSNEAVGNFTNSDKDALTQVPFQDYVPFLVTGAVIYGVWWMNRKKSM